MDGHRDEDVITITYYAFHAKYMRCGYDVPGMILLQSYLYTYSLLRGITFKAFPMSSYALRPMTLPMSETFLELLPCNSFQ
jgi:hypothetical protein